MPRFFVPDGAIADGIVRITGEDARHIARSLRMAAGETITVCDDGGTEYECVLFSFDDDKEVEARILSSRKSDREPPYRVTVFQAMPKGDKLESVTQKSVELGASAIRPFLSERCISRPDEKSAAKRAERLRRIAEEAAKQCGRAVIPRVETLCGYREMLADAVNADLCLFCYEGAGTQPLPRVLEATRRQIGIPSTVSVIVGSEGGFSPDEAAMAEECGCRMVGLGKRILRTETAPLCALSCLMYAFDSGEEDA